MDVELLIPIFAIVGFFAAVILFIYLFFTHRNRQRMALIQAGRDASIFDTSKDRKGALKEGMVLVGIGTGVLLGFALESIGLPAFVAYGAMVFLMTGAALIGYHVFVAEKEEKVREVV